MQKETPKSVTDPAFLSAKICALRAQILGGAEMARLANLDFPLELYRRILNTTLEMSPSQGQRAVMKRHAEHLWKLLKFVDGRREALLEWLIRRCQVDNIKVILRGWARGMTIAEIEDDLIPVPERFMLPAEKMLAAGEAGALVSLIPEDIFVHSLITVLYRYSQNRQMFFLEAALEKAYYTEALERASRLGRRDREGVLAAIEREVQCYNIIFSLRCLKTYELKPDVFSDLIVPFGTMPVEAFLDAPLEKLLEISRRMGPLRGAGKAVTSIEDVEDICNQYLYHAAYRQFVLSMFDLGAVVAYYYLKRFELQDILRLGEAIRLGLSAEEARKHLITAGA